MIKKRLVGFPVFLILCVLLLAQTSITPLAEKILTIGPGSAEGPYLFVRVEDVKADAAGSIYVLDSVRARVAKFNSRGEFSSTIGRPLFELISRNQFQYLNSDFVTSKLRSARESDELYFPSAVWLTTDEVYVADMSKVVAYSAEGKTLRIIRWKERLYLRGGFPNGQGEVVLLGSIPGRNQIFHVIDTAGNIGRSYGEGFEVPPKLAASIPDDQKQTRMAMMAMPVCSCFGPEGEAVVLSPFRYEIRIYRDDELWRTVTCPAPYEGGFAGGINSYVDGKPAGYSIGYIAPPVILRKNDVILVFQVTNRDAADSGDPDLRSFRVDVFKKYEFLKSFNISLEGSPKALSPDGHLFTVGSLDHPFVNEYVLKFLGEL